MKKFACILLISGMLTIFLGCPMLPLDSLDNHADPQTESYQGYLVIYDPDEIALSLADDSILTEPTFVVSEVIDAESYHIQIARDKIFGTVLFENDLFASNLIEAEGLETSLPKSLDLCYWRARAKVNGEWGEWSDTGSFVYLHPNTLYFDSQGGSTPVPAYKTLVEGSLYGDLATSGKPNKSLDSWWSKPDGKGMRITADTIVPTGKGQIAYAKWRGRIVSFDSNGDSAISSIENISDGSKIAEPKIPIKSGYSFGGWYKESAFINQWDFGSDRVYSDVTLYAKWNPSKNVASSSNGGKASANSVGTYMGITHYSRLANDGKSDSFWANSFAMPSWYQIEFKATHTITKIVVIWGYGSHNQRFSISTSTDGNIWTRVIGSRDSATNAYTQNGTYYASV